MNILLVAFVAVFFVAVPSSVEGSCDVVPIKVWGGSSSGFTKKLKTPVNLVVITHTVTSSCDSDAACERIVRAIRSNHIQQGYKDLRLSFLVGGNGKIYEAAGWNVGSFSAGYDDKAISLSFLGEFSNSLPTKKALKAAEKFLDCFAKNNNLGRDYTVVGHRQVLNTLSPGDALQRHIQTWPRWNRNIPKL